MYYYVPTKNLDLDVVTKLALFESKSFAKLSKDLSQTDLCTDGKFDSPLKVITKDKVEFQVNRGVISARSAILHRMFQSGTREAETGIVVLDEISSKSVNVLLHYISTGSLHKDWIDDQVIMELVYVADKFELVLLKEFLDDVLGGVCTLTSAKSKPRIELGEVTINNIHQLKLLNSIVFPVSYDNEFYMDVLKAGQLARVAYCNDVVVGGVICSIDSTEGKRRLYVMTIGCLAAYRRCGIGTIMLRHVINYVAKDGNFDSIYLHVQISNASAIAFYKKFGFSIVETTLAYYSRIEPGDAHVLQKNLIGGGSKISEAFVC